MNTKWLGKHRDFIGCLIKYANNYGQAYNVLGFHKTSVPCTLAQIQVIEYTIENEEKNQKMHEVAKRLGISTSAFSKNVKKMVEKGLLEKYKAIDNKKEIIVKASPLGRQVYEEYVTALYERRFKHTFELLDKVPEEYLNIVAEVLDFNAESIAEQMSESFSSKSSKSDDIAPPVKKLIKIT